MRRGRRHCAAILGGVVAPAWGLTRLFGSAPTDNAAPAVEITSPADNAIATVGVPLNIEWEASDSDGSIVAVYLYLGDPLAGGTLLATGAAVDAFEWTPTEDDAGARALYAIAEDDAGATTTSAGVGVTVNLPPAVAFTSPAPQPDPGIILNIGTAYTFAWSAADPDGSIVQVKLWVNDPDLAGWVLATGAAVGSYDYTPSGAELGANEMFLTAHDNRGARTKSAGLPVYVNARPTASVTAPAAGASVQVGVPVTVSWTASDYWGSVASVAIYLGHPDSGGTLLHTGSASGSYSWTPSAGQVGARTLYARPTDNLAQTGTSAGVAVTVAAANAHPTATVTAPAGGAVLVSGTASTISWTSSDSDGTVASVAIYLGDPDAGGTLLHSGGASGSYSFTPTDGQAGARTLYARATDNLGTTGTSSGVSVTVKTAIQNAIDSIKALNPAIFYYNAFVVDSGNAEAGTQISQWTDLSGNGNHATMSTQDDQPTIVSVGPEYRLTFDDADGTNGDCLVMPPAVYANQNYLTQFSAWRRNARTNTDGGPAYSTGGAAPGWAQYFTTTTSDTMRVYAGAGYSTMSGTWYNTDHVMCIRYDKDGATDADRLKGYIDNSPITLTNVVAIPSTGTGTVTTCNMARSGATANPGAISIDLHIVFQAALSDANRNVIDGHIKTLLSWYN